MEYTLRSATKDDYQYCYRLTRKNMYDLFCRHWGGWVASEFRKGFVVKHITMVIIAGRRSGYFGVKHCPDGKYIDNIQISPAWQGYGIGSDILDRIINDCDQESVRLTTFDDNPARRLYERKGFTVTERHGSTIKMEKQPLPQERFMKSAVHPCY